LVRIRSGFAGAEADPARGRPARPYRV